MPLYEYIDAEGNPGMVVGGTGVDVSFEMDAAEQECHDARLVSLKVEERTSEESTNTIGKLACRTEVLDTKAS